MPNHNSLKPLSCLPTGFTLILSLSVLAFVTPLLLYPPNFWHYWLFAKPLVPSNLVIGSGKYLSAPFSDPQNWLQTSINAESIRSFDVLSVAMLSIVSALPTFQLVTLPFGMVMVVLGLGFFNAQLSPKHNWGLVLATLLIVLGQEVLPAYYFWEGGFGLFIFLIYFGLLIRAFKKRQRGREVGLLVVSCLMLSQIYSGIFWEADAVFLVTLLNGLLLSLLSKGFRGLVQKQLPILITLVVVLGLLMTYDILFPVFLHINLNIITLSDLWAIVYGKPLQAQSVAVGYSFLSRVFLELVVFMLVVLALLLLGLEIMVSRRRHLSDLQSRWIIYSLIVTSPFMFLLDIPLRQISPTEGSMLLVVAVPALLILDASHLRDFRSEFIRFIGLFAIAIVLVSLASTFVIAADPANNVYRGSSADIVGTAFLTGKVGPYFADAWLGTLFASRQANTSLVNFVVYPSVSNSVESAKFLYNGTSSLSKVLRDLGVNVAIFRSADFKTSFLTANVALRELPQYDLARPSFGVVYQNEDLIVVWL